MILDTMDIVYIAIIHEMLQDDDTSIDDVMNVFKFAKIAHGDQKRKYTNEAYYNHPVEVALIMLTRAETVTADMIFAAILHDTLEDTETTYEDLVDNFGKNVANLVTWVSDISSPEDGNRKFRKRMDKEFIAQAPPEAKSIKLADLIHNTYSIVKYDKNFAKVYMREKESLLEVLTDGDKNLFADANQNVIDYFLERIEGK